MLFKYLGCENAINVRQVSALMEVDNNENDEFEQLQETDQTELFPPVAQNEEMIQETFAEKEHEPIKMRIIDNCSNFFLYNLFLLFYFEFKFED